MWWVLLSSAMFLPSDEDLLTSLDNRYRTYDESLSQPKDAAVNVSMLSHENLSLNMLFGNNILETSFDSADRMCPEDPSLHYCCLSNTSLSQVLSADLTSYVKSPERNIQQKPSEGQPKTNPKQLYFIERPRLRNVTNRNLMQTSARGLMEKFRSCIVPESSMPKSRGKYGFYSYDPQRGKFILTDKQCVPPLPETERAGISEKDTVFKKICINKRHQSCNLYKPMWIRGKGKNREGRCELCFPQRSTWFNLKQSTYWYHMNFQHGVNPKTGGYYESPQRYRLVGAMNGLNFRIYAHCTKCDTWVLLSESFKDPGGEVDRMKKIGKNEYEADALLSTDYYHWYKHSQRCRS